MSCAGRLSGGEPYWSDAEQQLMKLCSRPSPPTLHIYVSHKHPTTYSHVRSQFQYLNISLSFSSSSLLPTQLDNVMAESEPRTVCKTTSSVIVTSISSPSILHSPPGFHGNHKLTKTYSSVAKEPLDVSRLETTALQWTACQKCNDCVIVCVCVRESER